MLAELDINSYFKIQLTKML